jgi:adenosylcobinamide-GDP ribazoletransferase
MKRLIIALQFMTRLPMPRVVVGDGDFAASMRWFPMVGAIIGFFVVGTLWLGLYLDTRVAALAGLVMWIWITGALHLDGLADITDAAGAAHKGRERILAVLGDPHIGSFGVVAIVLQLLTKFVLLHSLLEIVVNNQRLFLGIIAVPLLARIGPLIWTCWLPTLHDGLGSRFSGAIRPLDLGLWCAVACIIDYFYPSLLLVVPAIVAWGLWIKSRIGGISGDGHGAGIEITESLLLLALVIGGRAL